MDEKQTEVEVLKRKLMKMESKLEYVKYQLKRMKTIHKAIMDSIGESANIESTDSVELHDLFGDSSDEEENYKVYIGKYEKEERKIEKNTKNTNNRFNMYEEEVEIYPELEKFGFKELGREIDKTKRKLSDEKKNYLKKKNDMAFSHLEYAKTRDIHQGYFSV